MKQAFSLIALVAAFPAFAEETRQLDAHEHGVGTLNIAVDGASVAMEFEAPGADIVGFEYVAESDTDLASIDAALQVLAEPLDLFVMPEAAGCNVTLANVELEGDHGEEHHDDHGEDHHDEDGEEHHDDHGEEHHDDHGEEDHDDHGDEHHDDHDDHGDGEMEHDDHAHDDHDDNSGHTEFHAEYALTCGTPDALTEIAFAYFDRFPNAQEVEVQIITETGAQAYEVERDAPVLKLER